MIYNDVFNQRLSPPDYRHGDYRHRDTQAVVTARGWRYVTTQAVVTARGWSGDDRYVTISGCHRQGMATIPLPSGGHRIPTEQACTEAVVTAL